MTLLSSTLRGFSETVLVPPKNKGRLVTQCHYYCTLENNDYSSSYHCTVPHTLTCRERRFPSHRRVLQEEQCWFQKGLSCSALNSMWEGIRAVSKHSVWPLAGQKCVHMTLCVCSGLTTEIALYKILISRCKSESKFRIQILQRLWSLASSTYQLTKGAEWHWFLITHAMGAVPLCFELSFETQ